ncbi:MAG: hypothetical protein ABH811_00570 [archaeon]
MKKEKIKGKFVFGIFLILFLFSIVFVSAFSVGMPYMEDKKLYLSPGDITDLEFVLQNSGGIENINAIVRIVEGSEIIERIDTNEIYVVVPGEQTKVNFRITIPRDALFGSNYNIKLDFSSGVGGGSFAFGSAIEQNFEVILGEKVMPQSEEEEETSPSNLFLYGGIAFVLIGLVVFFVIRNRKNK